MRHEEEGGATADAGCAGFWHASLPYRDAGELAAGVRGFVGEGLALGEPVLLAVPGCRLPALEAALGSQASQARVLDLAVAARNPARLIPAVEAFVADAGGRRCRMVLEAAWPGRPRAELEEALRYEALVDLAFGDAPLAVLCPYDVTGLGGEALAILERAHPTVRCSGDALPSPGCGGAATVAAAGAPALAPPAAGAQTLEFDHDLARLRRFVHAHALGAQLPADRIADLLVAANEAATNTLVHTGRPGHVRVWCDEADLVLEFLDQGRIEDPLAGCHIPGVASPSGRGLWLINQLCDLVQLRSGRQGTTLRLHMRLPDPVVAAGLAAEG